MSKPRIVSFASASRPVGEEFTCACGCGRSRAREHTNDTYYVDGCRMKAKNAAQRAKWKRKKAAAMKVGRE